MKPDLDPLGEAVAVATAVPTVTVERAPSRVKVTSAPLSMIETLIAFASTPGFLAAHFHGFAVAVAYSDSYTSIVGIERVYGDVTLSSDAVNSVSYTHLTLPTKA